MSTKPFAIITGASSGIGLELARVFGENGYDLLVCAEDSGINRAASELSSTGADVEVVQADLAKYDGVEQLWYAIEKTPRPIDAFALNAGVGLGGDFNRDQELDDILNMIELNVVSTVHLAKRVIPTMTALGRGRILFTSSIAATMPAPFESVYAASKAFVQLFAEGIREELKETGVTVTSLMPGPTETEFFHRAGLDDTKVGQSKKDDAYEVAKQGYEALIAGKDQVIAGSFKNKAMAKAANVLPESVTAKQHRKMTEPGSGE